jgi:copper chaperone CopZ
MKLEGLEDSLPGVAMVEASYRKGRMVVEYDESMLGEAAIQAAVEHMGYTVAAAKAG